MRIEFLHQIIRLDFIIMKTLKKNLAKWIVMKKSSHKLASDEYISSIKRQLQSSLEYEKIEFSRSLTHHCQNDKYKNLIVNKNEFEYNRVEQTIIIDLRLFKWQISKDDILAVTLIARLDNIKSDGYDTRSRVKEKESTADLEEKTSWKNLDNGQFVILDFNNSIPYQDESVSICTLKGKVVESKYSDKGVIEFCRKDTNKTEFDFALDEVMESKVTKLHINSLTAIVKYRMKFHQICDALKRFKQINSSLHIHSCLLQNYIHFKNDKYKDARLRLISMSKYNLSLDLLDAKQQWAIVNALTKKVTLIEGVAGSGKTFLASYIACLQSRCRAKKVLLTSSICLTVNKLETLIKQSEGLHVIRDIKKEIERQLKLTNKKLDIEQSHSYFKNNIDIVCCTIDEIVSCGDQFKIVFPYFDVLIIDDAQVISESECLIPLTFKSISQVIMLSELRREVRANTMSQMLDNNIYTRDMNSKIESSEYIILGHRNKRGYQSMPSIRQRKCNQIEFRSNTSLFSIVSIKKTHESHLTNKTSKSTNQIRRPKNQISDLALLVEKQSGSPGSLFERWIQLGIPTICLSNQYRMHPIIAKIVSELFYVNFMKSPSKISTTKLLPESLVDCSKVSVLYNTSNNHQYTSYIHETSGKVKQNSTVNCLITLLDSLNEKNTDSSVTIINNCHNRELISIIEKKKFNLKLGIGTARDFVGAESDFAILSYCKSSFKTHDFDIYKESSLEYEKLDLKGIKNNIDTVIDHEDYTQSVSALNIALTRARFGLFIVCPLEIFDTNNSSKCWNLFISYYKNMNLICSEV